MNEIKLKVNFGKRTCVKSGISLTTGDYNSTKIIFEFDREDGTKIFEMKNPNNEIIFVDEIVNNEVILVGQADITTKHNDVIYIKYIDDNETIYWYDSELDKLYDTSFVEVQNVSIDNLTKLTENASLFTMAGRYTFEISLYDGESKLTSKSDYLDVKEEQVVINDNMVSLYLPVFDRLIGELDNLDIDVSKSGGTTTVTLYRKDGTSDTIDIYDGLDGQDGEDGLTPTIGDNGNWYLGDIDTGKPSRGGKGDKGDTGNNGQDGYTPQKGIDYFTPEDIENLNIPTNLSDLNDDTTHRLVSDSEKSLWNSKSDFSGSYNDLTNKPTIKDAFIVTMDANQNGLTASHTPAEIKEAIDSGKVAYLKQSYYRTGVGATEVLIPIRMVNSTQAIACASGHNIENPNDNPGISTFIIDSQKNITDYDNYLLTSHQDISNKQDITDNTLTTNNKTVPTAINEVNSIAKGANQALSFSNYQSMITAFNNLANNVYKVGQNVMIITLNVPDLWISGIESTSQSYTYTSDSDFVNDLVTNGYVQVGYYKLSALETQKVDLTNYVQFSNYPSASTAGVIKILSTYATAIDGQGRLISSTKNYNEYLNGNNNMFISKGTLENVFTGKGFITSHQDITGKEDKSNKVTSLSANSTDTEYPSALAVYNYIQSLNGDEVNY